MVDTPSAIFDARSALDAAARVAETLYARDDEYKRAGHSIAVAIRALKDRIPATQSPATPDERAEVLERIKNLEAVAGGAINDRDAAWRENDRLRGVLAIAALAQSAPAPSETAIDERQIAQTIDTRYHVRSAHGRTIVVIDHLESAVIFAQGRNNSGVTGCTIHKITITEEPVQWEPN